MARWLNGHKACVPVALNAEPGMRICSHDLPSIRTALQPMLGCTEESMELWLVPALVIHFLACSDLIASALADSAGGQPSLASRKSCIPPPPPHKFLPRTPTSFAPQIRKTGDAPWWPPGPSLVRIHLIL